MGNLKLFFISIKNDIDFWTVYFCLNLLIKMIYLFNKHVFVFYFGTEIGTRTMDFHWYWYRKQKCRYCDNTVLS